MNTPRAARRLVLTDLQRELRLCQWLMRRGRAGAMRVV
jgi:hypothetical protein